jgi:AcrR family transcriptional regulator
VSLAETGKREQTKAANRTAILAAAREVFGELGYGGSSVRDIVRRTGLAAGTFYNYFPDKESIFRAVLEEAGEEARARVRAARRAATDVRGFVETSYRAYFEWIVEDPSTVALLARNAGAIRTVFDDLVTPLGVAELEEDLRAGVQAGLLPPTLDADYWSHVMVATGLTLGERLIERDPPDVDGATRFAAELFVPGLAVA